MSKTIAILGLLLAATVPVIGETVPDNVQNEIDRAQDLYRAVTAYHVMMQGENVTKEMVQSALFDVEHYVDEIDSRYGTAQLFIKDQKALETIKSYVAKAHFAASMMHARGVDLEGSITQYEKVVDLLGYDPADWKIDIERSAKRGLLPHAAEVAFSMATPRDVVEDLKSFWSAGVVTRFFVKDYSPDQRHSLKMERIGGATDPFSEASFQLAANRFTERLTSGLEEFRVVLPAGRYRVSSKAEGIAPVDFLLVQNGVPDPIVLNPNTFSFGFTAPDDRCRPNMTLNGLPVRHFSGLPFGTYRVEAPKSCSQRMPDKITVMQNSEMTLRSEPERLDFVKEGQPIFLFITTPPGSTYNLRM